MAVGVISNSLYDKLPNLTLGFHGCNRATFEKVIYRHEHLKRSENNYDLLGSYVEGIRECVGINTRMEGAIW